MCVFISGEFILWSQNCVEVDGEWGLCMCVCIWKESHRIICTNSEWSAHQPQWNEDKLNGEFVWRPMACLVNFCTRWTRNSNNNNKWNKHCNAMNLKLNTLKLYRCSVVEIRRRTLIYIFMVLLSVKQRSSACILHSILYDILHYVHVQCTHI